MNPYPVETLDEDDDDGTMTGAVAELAEAVVGHRIVSAEERTGLTSSGHEGLPLYWLGTGTGLVLTLDNGTQVLLRETNDCCAYTEIKSFLLHPDKVDHIITGVGTTDGYTTWHIYADAGDVMELTVDWSCGNPFYYAYGFMIEVIPVPAA